MDIVIIRINNRFKSYTDKQEWVPLDVERRNQKEIKYKGKKKKGKNLTVLQSMSTMSQITEERCYWVDG